ncbi:MAG: FAD-dependent oxidoreductase [Nanoarchaeota archaeon]
MKKIIIIGGGFAGSYAAKKLEDSFDVTLIDTKSYFEFTPGILRTIIEPKHLSKLQILHKNYLKNTKIITVKVSKIEEKYVVAQNKKYEYDYLLICSGSNYSSPIKEQNSVMSVRGEQLRAAYKNVKNKKSILIIGGGLVGVELAAEICAMYKNKTITLVNAKDTLVKRNKAKTQKYVTKFLTKNGVNIIQNEKVIKKNNNIFITNEGTKIGADIAFLCTGINPNTSFVNNKFLDEKKHIIVNNYMQMNKNVFAIGDVNNIKIEKTAQNASNQAEIAVKNMLAMENRKKLTTYVPKKTPLCISLGKWNGVLETDSFVLTGLIPGILKQIIELKEMLMLKH